MPTIQVEGLTDARPWNGYKGWICPPETEPLLRALGVEIQRRFLSANAKRDVSFARNLIANPDDALDQQFYWIVPPCFAVVARAVQNDAQVEPRAPAGSWAGVLAWMAKHPEGDKPFDAMLRLARDHQDYLKQVLHSFQEDVYK